jgi:hypothetical protein
MVVEQMRTREEMDAMKSGGCLRTRSGTDTPYYSLRRESARVLRHSGRAVSVAWQMPSKRSAEG